MSGYFGFSSSGGGGGGTSAIFGDLFPTDGTAAGFTDGTYIRPAQVHDLDTSGTNEFNLGVNLRTYSSGSSKEIGISSNPLFVRFPSNYIFPSNYFTEIDLHQPYQINQNTYGTRTLNGGSVSYSTSNGSVSLSTNTSNGSLAEIRTNQFYKIQLGKYYIIKQSLSFSSSGTNNETKMGCFDDNYGFYFKVANSLLSVGFFDTMSSGLTSEYSNSQFNNDKFDGSGPSGMLLDLTKYNLYEIRAFWHGTLILEFYVNGFLGHVINIYNNSQKPILQTNKLPICVKSINTSVSTSTSLEYNSASILIENGSEPIGNTFFKSNSSTKNVKQESPLLSFKVKQNINTISNRLVVVPKEFSISTNLNRIKYKLVLNPTLSGSSFASVNTYSGLDYDESSTSFSGGTILYSGYLNVNNESLSIKLDNVFNLYKQNLKQDAFGINTDILTIAAESDTSGFARVSSTLLWDEI